MIIDHPSSMIPHNAPSPNIAINIHNQEDASKIACTQNDIHLFQRFGKYKDLDKPKDSIALLKLNRLLLQLYTGQVAQTSQKQIQSQVDDLSTSLQVYLKKTYNHPRIDLVPQEQVLVTRIHPSEGKKCNIILMRMNGEVITYIPEVALIKKKEKVLKHF